MRNQTKMSAPQWRVRRGTSKLSNRVSVRLEVFERVLNTDLNRRAGRVFGARFVRNLPSRMCLEADIILVGTYFNFMNRIRNRRHLLSLCQEAVLSELGRPELLLYRHSKSKSEVPFSRGY